MIVVLLKRGKEMTNSIWDMLLCIQFVFKLLQRMTTLIDKTLIEKQ